MLRLKELLCVFTLAFSHQVFVQAEPRRDLEAARSVVLKALEYNPEVQSQWQAFIAADENVGTARAGYRPVIDLTARTGRERRDYDLRDDYTINQAELSLTQMLFDGFATRGEVIRLDNAMRVRFFELMNGVNTVSYEALFTMENVIRFRELVDLARDNYQQHVEVQGQIQDQVDQGVGRGSDLDQVNARVALAESNLIIEAANLHDVTARFLRIVGELPSDALVPSNLRFEDMPGSLIDVLHAAYSGNPGFHAAIKNIEAAEGAVKREKADYFPKFELRASTSTQQNLGPFDDRVNPDDFGDDSIIELAFRYNLYNGGADRAAIRRSLAEVNQAKALRDLACVNLRQDVQIAYNETLRIQDRLAPLRQHQASSDSVRSAYAEQFQIGQRTLLDMLDAQSEYFQASRAVVSAETELTVAHAELLLLTGRLLPGIGVMQEQLQPFVEVDVEELGNITVNPDAACPAFDTVGGVRATDANGGVLVTEAIAVDSERGFVGQTTTMLPSAEMQLDALLAQWKAEGGIVEVTVKGFSNLLESESASSGLATAWARAVHNYLIINGLETASVSYEGATLPYEQGERRGASDRVEIHVRRYRQY